MGARATAPWYLYQEEVAALFRELGFSAETNAQLNGARGSHGIDVLVEFATAGLDVTWIVECKRWKTRVSKAHVLTLRSIVEDTGADRGIILSESGFQSGALKVADHSNVLLSSAAELRHLAQTEIRRRRLLSLPATIADLHARYWSLPKSVREDFGLRPEGPAYGYSGAIVLGQAKDILFSALADRFPPRGDFMIGNEEVLDAEGAIAWIDSNLAELAAKLVPAEEHVDREN